jgi:hypothetical protein
MKIVRLLQVTVLFMVTLLLSACVWGGYGPHGDDHGDHQDRDRGDHRDGGDHNDDHH